MLTSGAVFSNGGHLPVHFTASDAGGLSCALLLRDGEVIGEMPLSGTSTDQTFMTPYYTFGTAATFAVHVYDAQGNKQVVSAGITPTVNPAVLNNHAPQPFFRAKPSKVIAGQPMLLDASLSSDPDHSASTLTVEWDLDNDGTFDTAPTTTKTYTTTFNTAGTRLIRCRVTDPSGAVSVSTPIGVRVVDATPTAVRAEEWRMYE
jgi:PKD repeat protein